MARYRSTGHSITSAILLFGSAQALPNFLKQCEAPRLTQGLSLVAYQNRLGQKSLAFQTQPDAERLRESTTTITICNS